MRNKPLFCLYTLTPATFICKQPNEAPAESKPPEESPYSVEKGKTLPAAALSTIHLPDCGGGTGRDGGAYQAGLTVVIGTVVQLRRGIPDRPLPVLTEVIWVTPVHWNGTQRFTESQMCRISIIWGFLASEPLSMPMKTGKKCDGAWLQNTLKADKNRKREKYKTAESN